jgi:1-acyl-sn-glycerol-3-phosphate acyltransferase
MTGARFHDILERTGGYRTPDLRRGPVARLLGRWDAWCHLRVIGVVWCANRSVRREGAYPDARWADDGCRMLAAYEACGAQVTIDGFERFVAEPGPRVVVANHMSTVETMVLPAAMLGARHVTVVVKESLARYPLFGPVIRGTGAIAVARRNPREDLKKVLTEGARALEDGSIVLMFPQATRSPAFQPARFNSLGAKLAARTGCPLQTVALRSDFLGVGRRVRDFGPLDRAKPIRMRFGAARSVGRRDEREAHRVSVDFISATLREWGVPIEGEVCDGQRPSSDP